MAQKRLCSQSRHVRVKRGKRLEQQLRNSTRLIRAKQPSMSLQCHLAGDHHSALVASFNQAADPPFPPICVLNICPEVHGRGGTRRRSVRPVDTFTPRSRRPAGLTAVLTGPPRSQFAHDPFINLHSGAPQMPRNLSRRGAEEEEDAAGRGGPGGIPGR